MAENDYCSDCKKSTEVVLDHSTGDTVCLECGLVLDSYYVDETSEWRTFADDSGDNADPNRVGGPTNLLLNDAPLSTFISKPEGGVATGFRYGPNPNPNRQNLNLIKAFEAIADMCDELGLVSTIKNRASEIFKNVGDQKAGCRIKNRNALMAACVYMACKQEAKPRTLKEICSVANGATMKEIGRAERLIAKQVPDMEIRPAGAQSGSLMMSRFGSCLGMKFQAVMAAQEAVGKLQELDIRRAPMSIAAAVIYMVTQLSEDKKSLQDVSAATGVAQVTIRDSYKDLHPHIAKIVPSWFTRTVKA